MITCDICNVEINKIGDSYVCEDEDLCTSCSKTYGKELEALQIKLLQWRDTCRQKLREVCAKKHLEAVKKLRAKHRQKYDVVEIGINRNSNAKSKTAKRNKIVKTK